MQGGKPFKTVTRVDAETLECPKGTKPCSNVTSPINTVCYPEDQHTSFCPITEILFTDDNSIDNYRDNPAIYTVKEFKHGKVNRYLVYSKNATDNLPISTTAVKGGNPCLNPNETPESNDYFYPLEYDSQIP